MRAALATMTPRKINSQMTSRATLLISSRVYRQNTIGNKINRTAAIAASHRRLAAYSRTEASPLGGALFATSARREIDGRNSRTSRTREMDAVATHVSATCQIFASIDRDITTRTECVTWPHISSEAGDRSRRVSSKSHSAAKVLIPSRYVLNSTSECRSSLYHRTDGFRQPRLRHGEMPKRECQEKARRLSR
jgi:hypothetical protein